MGGDEKMKGLSDYEKKSKSLKYSILDASLYSIMAGAGESFVGAYAVFLHATSAQLGLLGSLPQLVGSWTQLASNRLIQFFGSRQRFITLFATLQGLVWIPLSLTYFLGAYAVWGLIAAHVLYFATGMVMGPAWNSWMGDLVDEKQRGTYFGRRNRTAGMVALVSMLIAGILLKEFTEAHKEYLGFAILFGIAVLGRMGSVYYLSRKYEPQYQYDPHMQFTLLEFVKASVFRNFGRFVLYLCAMNVAIFIAAPFFAAYMLNDLHMDYFTFTLMNVIPIIVKFFAFPVWGKASDKYGAKRVLTLAGSMMPFMPLLWFVSTHDWWIALIQAFSGFAWAGFEIASFSYIFDCTSPQRRATCVAYLNVLNGVAVFVGAMLGSFIVNHNALFWSPFVLTFLISGGLRLVASGIFLPILKEMRSVQPIHYNHLLLDVVLALPPRGMVSKLNSIVHRKGQFGGPPPSSMPPTPSNEPSRQNASPPATPPAAPPSS